MGGPMGDMVGRVHGPHIFSPCEPCQTYFSHQETGLFNVLRGGFPGIPPLPVPGARYLYYGIVKDEWAIRELACGG